MARAYRLAVAVLGWAIIALGLLLVPLPGPGWAIVFVGLAVLASEFRWAKRLQDTGKRVLTRFSGWARGQGAAIRFLLGAGFLAVVAVCFVGYVALWGVPGWVPLVG